jgi:hypothetical protein
MGPNGLKIGAFQGVKTCQFHNSMPTWWILVNQKPHSLQWGVLRGHAIGEFAWLGKMGQT